MKELATIGIAYKEDMDGLIAQAKDWIEREKYRRHPRLDMFGEERSRCEAELLTVEQEIRYESQDSTTPHG